MIFRRSFECVAPAVFLRLTANPQTYQKQRKNRFDFNTAEQGLTRIAQLMHTTLQTYLADTSFTCLSSLFRFEYFGELFPS